jgi:HD-like signal output (HDOD) protein
MKVGEAIQILERHNAFMKGESIEDPQPFKISLSIDLVLKELQNLSYNILHNLGENILKHQFEIYNPLRKYVVEVPDITLEFDKAGVDIVPNVDF